MAVGTRTWTFHHRDGAEVEPAPVLPAPSADLPAGQGLFLWQGDPARMGSIVEALAEASSQARSSAEAARDVSAGTRAPSSEQLGPDVAW
jgi:hypothetical protein